MNTSLKTILITLGVVVLAVAIAGIYKFNYLSGQEGYDVDGNKTKVANPASEFCIAQGGTLDIKNEENGQVGYCTLPDGSVVEEWEYWRSHNDDEVTNTTTDAKDPKSVSTKTLEVIGVFGEMDGDSVELITLDQGERYSAIFSIPNLGDNYISVKQGDRLTITGEFSSNRILYITQLTPVDNPEREQCESQAGKKWIPQGKAQIPACITEYTDGGKACTSSDECQGDCIKTPRPDSPATCEYNSSRFGCKTTVEKFNTGEGILCID